MNKLTRWSPFGELANMRRDLDRLFDDSFFSPVFASHEGRAPLIDLYQTDDDVVVKASIPGVAPEDVDIQVSGDMLIIRAETKEEKEDKTATYHMREQSFRSYARSLALPVPVKADEANAEIVNGVLHLRLPKAEEAKPKSITVKAK